MKVGGGETTGWTSVDVAVVSGRGSGVEVSAVVWDDVASSNRSGTFWSASGSGWVEGVSGASSSSGLAVLGKLEVVEGVVVAVLERYGWTLANLWESDWSELIGRNTVDRLARPQFKAKMTDFSRNKISTAMKGARDQNKGFVSK